ncbi:MAG: hypothetical protein SFU56_03245 [Capsulimonadales bacterium]|nr:hypothetical protein [Capsulimonadales bacterium]
MAAFSGQRTVFRRLSVATVATALTLAHSSIALAQTPKIAPPYQDRLMIELANPGEGRPTQFAWGPEGRLYVATNGQGVFSYRYDRLTGLLSDRKLAVREVRGGIGIAFHRDRDERWNMYLTVNDDSVQEGAIVKLNDTNRNGVWGEVNQGELRVRIVQRIPIGDHAVDQLIVRGNSLFVGIGRRTINGRRGPWSMGSHSDDPNDRGFWGGGTGFSWGDSPFHGTIAWIENLNAVVNETDSANVYSPNEVHDRDFYQTNARPYRIILNQEPTAGKLLIHSAGTRNPFGLALDRMGNLWFTNNFNRTVTTGDGKANDSERGDPVQADLRKGVHDQLFKARWGADYGYHDDNWRGAPFSFMMPENLLHVGRVFSTTFDNLFNNGPYVLHNPADPDGLGPNSSANGISFFYAGGLPRELENNAFIVRFSGEMVDSLRQRVDYRDLVAVHPETGRVRRVAFDFNAPLAVLWDGGQRLLIGDYGNGRIYTIRPALRRIGVRAEVTRPRANGNVIAEVVLKNTGDLPLSDIALTGAVLRDRRPGNAFPIPVLPLASGESSRTIRLEFPRTVPSGPAILEIRGRYNGIQFTSAIRTVVP